MSPQNVTSEVNAYTSLRQLSNLISLTPALNPEKRKKQTILNFQPAKRMMHDKVESFLEASSSDKSSSKQTDSK